MTDDGDHDERICPTPWVNIRYRHKDKDRETCVYLHIQPHAHKLCAAEMCDRDSTPLSIHVFPCLLISINHAAGEAKTLISRVSFNCKWLMMMFKAGAQQRQRRCSGALRCSVYEINEGHPSSRKKKKKIITKKHIETPCLIHFHTDRAYNVGG